MTPSFTVKRAINGWIVSWWPAGDRNRNGGEQTSAVAKDEAELGALLKDVTKSITIKKGNTLKV